MQNFRRFFVVESRQRLVFGAICAMALASLGVTHPAIGQVIYAAVHGTVTDQSGAVVPASTVTITNTSTGKTVQLRSTKYGRKDHGQLS